MTGKKADTSVPVNEIIANRWSPRSLDPAGTVPEPALRAILEAARWAPSHGNIQPARYLVGRRGDRTYQRIFDTLRPRNQWWAGNAAVLMIACAVTVNEKGDIPLYEYAVGLSAENLVLEAVAQGLVAHQMEGFFPDAAHAAFELPAHVRPLVAIAVGVQGSPDALPDDQRDRELRSRKRLPLAEIAMSDWGTPAFIE